MGIWVSQGTFLTICCRKSDAKYAAVQVLAHFVHLGMMVRIAWFGFIHCFEGEYIG